MRPRNPLLFHPLSIATVAIAICIIGSAALVSNRGIGLTDEAYNYLWIRYAPEYDFTIRFHGYVLHPISSLFGHSLIGLRLLRLSVELGLALAVVHLLLGHAAISLSRFERLVIGATLASTVGLDNVWWLTTPTYNAVTAWGVSALMIGLTVFLRLASEPMSADASRPSRPMITAAVFTVVGMFLATSRPPTALLSALFAGGLVLVVLIRNRRQQDVLAFVALCASLTAILSVLIGLTVISPAKLWNVTTLGMSIRANYDTGNSVFLKYWSDGGNIPAISIFAVGWTLAARSAWRRWCDRTGWWMLVGPCVLALVAAFELWTVVSAPVPALFFGGFMFDLSVAWIVYTAMRQSQNGQSLAALAPGLFFIVAPLLALFGTNASLPRQLGAVQGLFAYSIILTTVAVSSRPAIRIACFVVAVLSAWSAYCGMARPYYVATDIGKQVVAVTLPGINGEELLVDGKTAKFVNDLKSAASTAGLQSGMPLLDLTGRNPGLNLILGTRPPVYPWLAGDEPNSSAILDVVWSRMSADERNRAWIAGPANPSFAKSVAYPILTPLDRNYVLVVRLVDPVLGRQIELWKPKP